MEKKAVAVRSAAESHRAENFSKDISTMQNNLAVAADRFGGGYVRFCLKEMSRRTGYSQQQIMCRLLMTGMHASPEFSLYMREIERKAEEAGLMKPLF